MADEEVLIRLPNGEDVTVVVEQGATDQEIMERLDKLRADPTSNAPFSREAYYRELNRSMSPMERFATAFDRGVTRLGSWVTGEEDEATKAAADDLTSNYTSGMAGDIVGKTAPLLPMAAVGTPGVVAGRALPAASTTLGRIGTGMAAGAAEGALVAKSEGQNAGTGAAAGAAIAGASEAVIPVLGRLAGQVYRRTFGRQATRPLIDGAGNPSEELTAALRRAGIRFEDLQGEAYDFVARNADNASPEQLARAARFKSQGIDATRGQISQRFPDQAKEARLAEMITEPTSEPLRQRLSTVNQQFTDAVEGFASSTGSARAAGDSVKTAIEQAKTLSRNQKNAAYKAAEKLAKEYGGVPVPTSRLTNALPDDFARRARLLPDGQVRAFNDLLVEFGIDQSDEAVEAFTKRGGTVRGLTVENAEEFRQALRQFGDGQDDVARRWQSVTGDMLNVVDDSLDDAAEILARSGDEGAMGVSKALKAAREANRRYRGDFSPQSLAGRLINTRPDGVTPVVEASRVMREFRTKPVEQLQRTLQVMSRAGDSGVEAIRNMRASVVLDALEESLKAPSNKYGGKQLSATDQFSKFLEKRFGRDRLEMLFKGDETSLRQLNALMQTGLDLQPPAKAMPKGSAAVNMDMFGVLREKLGPALYGLLTPIRAMVEAGVERGQVSTALNPTMRALPETKAFVSAYPGIATLLGIQYVAEEDE